MKKVLVIISEPQECGTSSIDLISLDNGEVIDYVEIDRFYNYDCMKYLRREIGDDIEAYVTEKHFILTESYIGKENQFSLYSNEECEIPRIRHRREDRHLLIKDMVLIKTEEIKDSDPLFCGAFDYTKYIYKLTLCRFEEYTEYSIEDDDFYYYLKDKCGLELTFPERRKMDKDEFARIVTNKLGYEVVNILHY